MEANKTGGDIFIVGGGKSLTGFNFMRLKDKQVIACNRAFEFVPWAIAVCFWDSAFYKYYKRDLQKFNGWKVTHKGVTGEDAKTDPKIAEIDPNFNGNVNNTGHFAIQVALEADPDRIFLLGFDMDTMLPKGAKPGDINFYNYPDNFSINSFRNVIHKFDVFKGLPIYNCNPDSGLRQFEFMDIDSVL